MGVAIYGESAYYLCVNRKRRDIVVNLKTDEGRDLPMADSPLNMGETPFVYRLPLPLRGVHTSYVEGNIKIDEGADFTTDIRKCGQLVFCK